MKKWLNVSIIMTMVVLVLSACGGNKTEETASGSGGGSNKLVVYTPNSEAMINALIPAFEKQTGITVELVSAGSGELIKRIQSEKSNPYADVMFGGAYALFNDNADLFEEYVSPNDKDLLEGHTNTTGIMTSYVSDGSVLLVNTNLAGDIQINGYADLLNPELKGKIAMADPANSSSAFAQLTNMLKAMGGDYTSEAGWDYVAKLLENLDGKIAGGSSKAHKSVADGEYVVALTYEDPAVSYVRDGAPVKVVYPEEGTVFLDAVAGVVKGSPNQDNAKKFIDFLISQEGQDALGQETTNRPLRTDAAIGDFMTPIEQIKVIDEDVAYVAENKAAIVERYTELFTDIAE
ncbi:ABC transporter substrate-binding protein [Paenibacillus typhae]|uniref:Iron(III) transport system substrate-binding protein n=1 Tax=Paenibacillus typhae TaxID=1174501 RepID=A0A1G8T9U2_9BACL|nr:ABC transporter substrate-binding protein [Paenibacillus typhae]MBY0008855.1 extracellular solute-binding protein [Paenibacillus typhae]SDJ37430.1 iron(III) transport system substrate-binding protein [Paenibacillus typhae]